MTAPHFFAETVARDVIRIAGAEARHATRVLRVTAGETITISDGRGSVVEARCVEASEHGLVAEVLERRTVDRPRPHVVVYPALAKSTKLDIAVQKLTEIGVGSIRPWAAARSVVRWDEPKLRARADRLRAIAREAAKQSRRAWLPEVADPAPIERLPAPAVVLHEQERVRLGEVLPADPPHEIGLVVGPEGGLEPGELERLASMGARAAGLGDPILRAETASIVAATLVLARYGRLG